MDVTIYFYFSLIISHPYCHNPIFTLGIFLGVGTQNEAARAELSSNRERLNYIKSFLVHSWEHIYQDLRSFDQC
jgi:hypothetical protein